MAVEFDKYTVGEDQELLQLDSGDDNRAALARLLEGARHKVAIYSRILDPRIYNTEQVSASLQQLALSGGLQAEIRIVVTDPLAVVRSGHRLYMLSQRLSSFVHIRRAPDYCKSRDEDFIVLDGIAFLHRETDSRFESTLSFNDRYRCRELLNSFDRIWGESSSDPNLHGWNI